MLSGREEGFGLVELVVAAFITMIVIGVFSGMFYQAFRRNSETDAQALSSARLSEAMDRMGDDVRAARSAGRGNIAMISTRDDLFKRMKDDPVGYGDIAWAGGRVLAAWTDGLPGANGPRCATYALEQVQEGRTQWALVRRMTAAGAPCPAPVGTPREVLALLGADAPARDAFRYNVLVPEGVDACRIANVAPAVGTLDAQQRLRIVSIDVDLASINERRGRQRSASGRTSIDLWSRLNDDYYYALGCAQ